MRTWGLFPLAVVGVMAVLSTATVDRERLEASAPVRSSPSVTVALPIEDQVSDPATDPGVESLVRDEGISSKQAIRQMEVQVSAGVAEREMPPELRAVYAGRRIDHDRGGRVTVAVTDPAMASAMRAYYVAASVPDVETVVAPKNVAELDATAEALQRRYVPTRAPGEEVVLRVGRGALGR